MPAQDDEISRRKILERGLHLVSAVVTVAGGGISVYHFCRRPGGGQPIVTSAVPRARYERDFPDGGIVVGDPSRPPPEGWSHVTSRAGEDLLLCNYKGRIADGEFSFLGEILHRGLYWIFRAVDPDNFYRGGLTVTSKNEVVIEHVAVLGGEHRRPLVASVNYPIEAGVAYPIILSARGGFFDVSINGEHHFWNDPRLKDGMFGFCGTGTSRSRIYHPTIAGKAV